jgi:ATPase family associated with various cellular activities (AAA)
MSQDRFSPEEFGAAYQRFMEWAAGEYARERSPFKTLLSEHFGADPGTFPVTGTPVAQYDLPNLQLALDAYLERPGVVHELVGFGGHLGYAEMSLSGLVHDQGFGISVGPVRRTVVDLDGGRSISCVNAGLFLISAGEVRLAALVMRGQRGWDEPDLRVEVIAPEQQEGERFLSDLRELMREKNVYRGKVLAFSGGDAMRGQGISVEFPRVEPVGREAIVLPEGVLDVIELHTLEFARHIEKLQRGGRHLRRGLLLHGPPGTGKTLSAEYLISRLEGRTVIILTGSALGLIGEACSIARELQPAMVVLEDIDLVAQERTMENSPTSLLFQLLNEMDGIGEDADVIFLMTTNRADLLEPALAARPGRVDQAVELPLPDEEARARLLSLFGSGLDLRLEDEGAVVAATAGVSPAFLRELVRKAALQAAVAGSDRVEDAHFSAALALLESGGPITRAMLGADGGEAARRLGPHDMGGGVVWESGGVRRVVAEAIDDP